MNTTMEKKQELLIRLYLVLAAFVLVAVVIVYRVVKVNVMEGDKWRSNTEKNFQWRPIEAD